jgi:SET domain-containing protein
MTKVFVADSTIHGRGVFAATPFERGEEILQIDDSQNVTRERAPGKYNEEEVDYRDYLDGGNVVLMQPPERHINHSCDPNTYVKTIDGIRRLMPSIVLT